MSENTPSVRSKFPDMGTNIFTTMNMVAKEYGAINLAQGFPGFDCPEQLRELVVAALRNGKNQYAPMPGVPELREAISHKIRALHNRAYDPETEITVTPGGHAALMAAATAVLHPGDEVILFDPSFDCFLPIIRLNGAVPRLIKLNPPDHKIDWTAVQAALSPRTRLIWLNTPHNPTGATLTQGDMTMLAKLLRGTEILVLSDEVYEHIIFDGRQHESVCRHPELAERSFAVFSFGKVYHATGWKVGYCVAPQPLMQEFRKIYQMTQFTVHHPSQVAIAEFLAQRDHYLSLPSFYQRKRDLFLSRLKSSRFDFTPAEGTYFQSLTYGRISDEPAMSAAKRFARDAKVASIPLSAFYSDGTDHQMLRFCFAKSDEMIEQAAEALCKI